MKKSVFLERFGLALKAFSERTKLKDELGAWADAKRAGLPLLVALPHPQTAQSLMVAAQYPHLAAVEAEKAWRAHLPWYRRIFCC